MWVRSPPLRPHAPARCNCHGPDARPRKPASEWPPVATGAPPALALRKPGADCETTPGPPVAARDLPGIRLHALPPAPAPAGTLPGEAANTPLGCHTLSRNRDLAARRRWHRPRQDRSFA